MNNHLQEVMYALARFMDKPRNPVYAAMDLFEVLNNHGAEALKDYDELIEMVKEAEQCNPPAHVA